MDEQELKLIEQYTNAATPEPWDWAYREFGTPEEAREWLGNMLDYNSANLFINGAAHMEDGSHAPPVLEDVWAFVMPIISGNGPTSEANAKFCCIARSAVPLLISEVKQQRSDLIAVRKRAERAEAEAAADRAALAQARALLPEELTECVGGRGYERCGCANVDKDNHCMYCLYPPWAHDLAATLGGAR